MVDVAPRTLGVVVDALEGGRSRERGEGMEGKVGGDVGGGVIEEKSEGG